MAEFLTKIQIQAIREIRSFMACKGRSPSVRELMISLGYKSPRSAANIINDLIHQKILLRKDHRQFVFLKNISWGDSGAMTVDVPLVGIAPCGSPVFAEENIQTTIPVSISIAKPPYKYFLVKAKGDSMDLSGISDGDLVLSRQQSVAESGDRVIALINNEVTIKLIKFTEGAVILLPNSSNAAHKPIILGNDFEIQGVITCVIPLDGV
ncbi:MAG: repressor LexA [Candidatus Omnitrophica bacterium]|nr:repressor LexA [Candidatus Omnitrophota bacterium]